MPWYGRAVQWCACYSVRTARRCCSMRISTRSRSSRRRVLTSRFAERVPPRNPDGRVHDAGASGPEDGAGSMPRGTQDLSHGGRRHGDAEFRQFALDPAVSPQRILLRQPNDQVGDARDCWRTAGLAPPARVVPSPRQFALLSATPAEGLPRPAVQPWHPLPRPRPGLLRQQANTRRQIAHHVSKLGTDAAAPS
jgi:hypothetical protein